MNNPSLTAGSRLGRRTVRISAGALLVGAAPLAALLATSTADAATISVTTTSDSGEGSLRAALAAASSGDTIDLSGISGTIDLADYLPIHTNVSIIGPGAADLTLDSAGPSIFAFTGSSGLTTISGLTLTGALYHGAISCNGHTNAALKIQQVVVTGNGGSTGGGLYSKACHSLEIVDSTFSYNSSSYYGGGGIHVETTQPVTISGSTFDHNTLTGTSTYARGGGAFIDTTDSLSITDSSFTNNYAYYQGAGAVLKANTLTITGSDFSLNSTYIIGGGGAGAYLSSNGQTSTATISNSSFVDNTGYMGGGIYASNFTTFTMSSSSISGNSTVYKGAGVLLKNDANNIFNTTIAENEVGTMSGGAAYITGDTQMKFVTMASNTAVNSGFGGLYLHGGTWTIDSSIIAENGSVNIKKYNTNATASQSVLGAFDNGAVSTDATDALGVTDAGLSPLADNGGSTKTLALSSDSVAVDRVVTFPAPFPGGAYDQRGLGFDRITGTFADAGAFEYGSVPPTTTTSTSTTSTTTPSSTSTSSTVAPTTSTTTPTSTSTTVAPTTTTVPGGDAVSPEFNDGDNVRNGDLQTLINLTGLTPGSAVTVTIHSEPIVLATGFADADGNFSQYVTVPADTPAGSHAITVTGTDVNGAPIERSLYFSLDANGVVTAISSTGPTPDPTLGNGGLPTTGSNDAPLVAVGAGLLAIGGAAAAFASRRRRI